MRVSIRRAGRGAGRDSREERKETRQPGPPVPAVALERALMFAGDRSNAHVDSLRLGSPRGDLRAPDRIVGTLSELAASIRAGSRFALFLGAGSSACKPHPSIPTGEELVEQLRARRPRKNLGRTYASVIAGALPRKSDRRAFFESICAGRLPCRHHYELAALAEHRIFPLIYTTNFDRVIETALWSYCLVQPTVYLHDVEFGDSGLEEGVNPKIVKLHGDVFLESLANLTTELREKLHTRMRARFLGHLRTRGLVVLGYGGGDHTIMTLFKRALVDPAALPHGLWWILRKTTPSGLLRHLIDVDRRNQGKLHVVTGRDADAFFGDLCPRLGIEVRPTPRFGLNGRRLCPVVGLPKPFPDARHALTTRRRAKWARIAPSVREAIERQLSKPGTFWLVAPWPSAEEALASALLRSPGRPVFYFRFAFARNDPPARHLCDQLSQFATGCGIPAAGTSFHGLLRRLLLRRNPVLVIADVIRRRVSAPEEWGWDSTDWQAVLDIVGRQGEANRGNVVLLDRRVPPLMSLPASISVLRLPEKDDMRPHSRQLNPARETADQRRLLDVLAALRFAEHASAFQTLSGVSRARTVLDRLVARGLAERQADRYRISDDVRGALLRRNPISPSRSRQIANGFEVLAPRSSRGESDLQALHYLLEAEYHYFTGGRPRKALLSLLRLGGLEGADAGTRAWLAGTLADFFRLEAFGNPVVSAVSPSNRCAAVLLLHLVGGGLAPDSAVNRGLWKVNDTLPKAWRFLLHGRLMLQDGQLARARRQFMKGYAATEGSNERRLRASLEMLLGETLDNEARLGGKPAAFRRARTWYERAAHTYHGLRTADAEAVALDNVFATYLSLGAGDSREALNVLSRAQRVLTKVPWAPNMKGVLYGNVAFAYLLRNQVERGEGCFVESAAHYQMAGNFNGLATLYLWLYGHASKLSAHPYLSARRLYRTAFYTWGYARPTMTFPQMFTINRAFLGAALRERRIADAAMAMDHLGYILRGFEASLREELGRSRLRAIGEVFGLEELEAGVFRRLERSKWWDRNEVEALRGGRVY